MRPTCAFGSISTARARRAVNRRRLLRSHARLARPPRRCIDLEVEARRRPGDRQLTTPSRTSASPSVRRSEPRSATVRGSTRYGSAMVPMDECLACRRRSTSRAALVALRRAAARRRDRQLRDRARPTSSSAPSRTNAKLTLHVRLLGRQNAHHVIEGPSRRLRRALAPGSGPEPTARPGVPSTKGACDRRSAIAVLDYEMSNLRSADKALEHVGARRASPRARGRPRPPTRSSCRGSVASVRRCAGSARLGSTGRPRLERPLGRPLLGICLGMQLLFDDSDESPDEPGSACCRDGPGPCDRSKLPHIGWNSVRWAPGAALCPARRRCAIDLLLRALIRVESDPRARARTRRPRGETFCAAAGRENVIGVQFHPEKSSDAGLGLLGRWLAGVGAPATS